MTFVDDADSLLRILSPDRPCPGDGDSQAGLDGLKLSSIFGLNSAPLNQIQTRVTQLDSANPSGNGCDSQSNESNHVAPSTTEKLKNLDPISIQYTEKEKRERKYECRYCQKRFSRPSSLTSHVYTHTGERPFACDFVGCTKRFSVLSNLRRHYKVHSSRRTYGGVRPHGTSFHSSIYASAIPGGNYSFGSGVASLTEPASNRPIPASFMLHQEHSAMHSDCSAFALAGRELFSSPIASQAGSCSANRSVEYSSIGTSSYAPSFRTTASALSLPESLEASLLAGFANEQILPLPGYQGPLSLNSGRGSSDSLSPTSQQAPYPANLGANDDNSYAPEPIVNDLAATSQLDSAITTSQFEALFGRFPTENKLGNSDTSGASGSDSDNSSDHAPVTTDMRLLPLGEQGYGASSPDSLDALDMLIKASSSTVTATNGGSSIHAALSEFFPRSPRIATQTVMTNTSVTTKAMNGAIDPVGGASQDLAMLLSLAPSKNAPLALVDLPPPLPPHHHLTLHQANAPAFTPPGAKLLGSIGGMTTSNGYAESGSGDSGINDSVWQVLHTGHSQSFNSLQ
ncbi:hypothetical protein H4S07_002980 [Coemansia furcata]|uniref:Uncharacterized protein n=1 Tax=Coemansia furcata TaxID=417177 RepID=A0ACC1LK21_9FUNG|nr:hypothetical protein H4S07_002980 [Coemansia furcata]